MKLDHFILHLEAYDICVRRKKSKEYDLADGSTIKNIQLLLCRCNKMDVSKKLAPSDIHMAVVRNNEIRDDNVCMICSHFDIPFPTNLEEHGKQLLLRRHEVHKNMDSSETE